jgi:pimeloyl-ACP methyl ester carboxylesterase
MSADQTRILGEIAELLRAISESLLPGEDITLETRIVEDLELTSIGLANLCGRIQTRYGATVNVVPFFAARDAGPLVNLQVGELVDYLVEVLNRSETADPAELPARFAGQRSLSPAEFDGTDTNGSANGQPAAAGPQARNENAAVLAEHAPAATRSVLQLPGGQVEVFTAGDGPPLILMHPINVGAGVFARQFAHLADSYQVICMHNPGVGATTWDRDLSLTGLAGLYRTVLAELSIEPPFHVMGSSFGGIVAQEFALLHPAECASLTLVSCSYRIGARRGIRPLTTVAQGEFDRIQGAGGDQTMDGGRPELEELLLRCESMDPRAGLGYLNTFASRPNLFAQLPEIVVPTLVMRGQHDTMVPAKHAHLLYGAIPDAQFAEIADAGHFPCLTHPGQVHDLLTPFLAAHTGDAQPAAMAARVTAAHRGALAAVAAVSTPPPDPCAIIISSGRCGSTLLSNLIAEEPETLSVSESLGPLRGHLVLMPLTPLTGAQYWALLSEPGPLGSLISRTGVVVSEIRYPDTGRWAANRAALPAILYATLPGVSADPDLLFDVLAEKVPQFPRQAAGQHHKMLLDLLAAITGRRRWVERSGASSFLTEPLLAAFPEAKIVYLTRNVADTARSMSGHAAFQLTVARQEFHVRYGADPYSPRLRRDRLPDAAELPEELRRLLPDQMTAQALQELGRDVGRYEVMCAHMMGAAEQALADRPPRHLLRMRYEDLVADPLSELSQLGEFLGFADASGWAATAAERVRSPRARTAQPA